MKRARELDPNMHHLKSWKPPDMRGRVRHDTIWRRALGRWKPGIRVTVRCP